MTIKEFTKEAISKLTTKEIKAIDVTSVTQEQIINEVLNERMVPQKSVIQFNYRHVPNIVTPEQEKEWQAKIDEFHKSLKPVETQIVDAQKELESIKAEATAIIESVPQELAPVVSEPILAAESHGCDQCERKFSSEVALKVHKTRSHKVITN